MSLPYLRPVAEATHKRCQFSLTGKRQDCRRIGKYIFEGKRYCVPHYDVAWRIANPLFGTQHDFKLDLTIAPWPLCSRCGGIKPYDGLPISLCKGKKPILRPAEGVLR